MGKKGFQELLVWQRGRELAVLVYQLTSSNHFPRDYSLRDQMRRAAISIPSNIAEGDERETDKEAIRSFYVAKGSTAELLTQALIAQDIGYLNQQQVETLSERCKDILRMLVNLIRARSRSPQPNPISAG